MQISMKTQEKKTETHGSEDQGREEEHEKPNGEFKSGGMGLEVLQGVACGV